MRRRSVIAAVVGLGLVLAGLGTALAAGGPPGRAHQAPVGTLHQALIRQLRVLNRRSVLRGHGQKHAPTILVPGGAGSCPVNGRGCSLKPCVEFAASGSAPVAASAPAVSASGPAVDELTVPQVRAVGPGARPPRTDCRAVPAVGQQRLVPVSLTSPAVSG
jgi:hypothetical protein